MQWELLEEAGRAAPEEIPRSPMAWDSATVPATVLSAGQLDPSQMSLGTARRGSWCCFGVG